MKFKRGVNPLYLSAPAWHGLWKADELHKELVGEEATCTSTGEGKHSVLRSKHYTGDYGFGYGQAFDLRIWAFPTLDEQKSLTSRLQKRLGKDYVVLLEKTHIHVHWGPQYHEPTNS